MISGFSPTGETGGASSSDEMSSQRVLSGISSAKTAITFSTDIFLSVDVFMEVPEESDEAQRYLGKGTHFSRCAVEH